MAIPPAIYSLIMFFTAAAFGAPRTNSAAMLIRGGAPALLAEPQCSRPKVPPEEIPRRGRQGPDGLEERADLVVIQPRHRGRSIEEPGHRRVGYTAPRQDVDAAVLRRGLGEGNPQGHAVGRRPPVDVRLPPAAVGSDVVNPHAVDPADVARVQQGREQRPNAWAVQEAPRLVEHEREHGRPARLLELPHAPRQARDEVPIEGPSRVEVAVPLEVRARGREVDGRRAPVPVTCRRARRGLAPRGIVGREVEVGREGRPVALAKRREQTGFALLGGQADELHGLRSGRRFSRPWGIPSLSRRRGALNAPGGRQFVLFPAGL
jgi:hypothetical protein